MENFESVKGIIFDYGGTIDSHGDHWSEIMWDAYKDAGIDIDKTDFRNAYVWAERHLAVTPLIKSDFTFYDTILTKIKLELSYLADNGILPVPATIEELSEQIARYCDDAARQSVDEAKSVLEKLYQRYPMVLVSNFYGNVESVLEAYGIRRYFKTVIESAVVGVRKPDPAIFALGVKALGLEPDEVLVVGDSLKKDIYPARSLGCHTAWLKGKGWTPEEDAATDKAQINSLDELSRSLL